jgi:hypothetical protein
MKPGAAERPAWQDHTVLRAYPRCRQLFVLFQGLAGRMMMPPLEFLRLAGLTDRNLLIIRDRSKAYYQLGVSDEIPNIPALLAWQEQKIAELPHVRDLYYVGSSSGAYAAILFGHLLRAREVFAFAPPAELSHWLEQSGIECPDRSYVDLRPLLMQSNGVTRYHIYFNETVAEDLKSARHLEGCPGVELHPQSGTDHGVIPHMAHLGLLQTLMPKFVPA